MLIPKFWAEARLQHKENGKQLTLRRMGWSNVSQGEAQQHANLRVEEALKQALLEWPNTTPRKRDHKAPYNGADGLPIREEILEERNEGVLTRNSYGAVCLNTPNVMFVDIDQDDLSSLPKGWGTKIMWLALMLGVGRVVSQADMSTSVLGVLGQTLLYFLGLWVVLHVATTMFRQMWLKQKGGLLGVVHKVLHKECKQTPNALFALYQTPNGARVLALHQIFDPTHEDAQELMKRLHVDHWYAQMCLRQACFRARVSPKPWRIGVDRLQSPVWPVEGEVLDKRVRWVSEYNQKHPEFASCAFVEMVGEGVIDPTAEQVMHWHDELAQAKSGKKMA